MTSADFEWLKAQLADRIHRMEVYQDDLPRLDLLAWLKDLDSTLGDFDDLHSECGDRDHENELERDLDEMREKLEKRMDRSKLHTRIKGLEADLSDARADIAVYKERVAKGVTHMVLAENFAFTPEEARAQFRAIPGGAA